MNTGYSATLFVPSVTAIGGSLTLTALVSVLPLLVFFALLGVFKTQAELCAAISLVVALLVATLGMGMPLELALLSGTQGALFAFFPILFIVIAAVWNYRLTEESGRSNDMRTVFALVGKGDKRVQVLLIAFAFCGLLEGLAGFGAPVAITVAILYAIGVPPVKAAVVTMVGNAFIVGFGAMGIPVTTVGALGGENPVTVGALMGHITPLLVSWAPLVLLWIVDGKRGVREVWPAGLVAGVAMAAGHFVGAQFLTYELTAVFASLLSFGALAAFLRFWSPRTPKDQASEVDLGGLTPSKAFLSLFPYGLIVVVLAVAKLWKWGVDVPALLASTDLRFPWPGLHGRVGDLAGEVFSSSIFILQPLSAPGFLLLLCGVVVSLVYAKSSSASQPFTFRQGIATLGQVIYSLRLTIVSIVTIMALAYVMNFSGQTVAIGTLLAATGAAFAFLSPLLGWVGTAVTGSATSSAALFANLQAVAAGQAGLDPALLLAANQIGGGLGKIVSPQNLSIAASASRRPGSEPELLRSSTPYSVGFVLVLGVIVLLISWGPLSFLLV